MDRSHDFFFFNDTATTEIYTLSLHDALPIYIAPTVQSEVAPSSVVIHTIAAVITATPATVKTLYRPVLAMTEAELWMVTMMPRDRKSTRLNSSHANISYAVFCLKKKKKTRI